MKGALLCVLSFLFGIIHYRCHCETISRWERCDIIVLLRWEEQRHLVKMRKKKTSYRGLWKCRCVCVNEPNIFFGVTGEYRLMSQPRGHCSGKCLKVRPSNTPELSRTEEWGLCEFKSGKRKWDLRLARDCEELVCSPRSLFR